MTLDSTMISRLGALPERKVDEFAAEVNELKIPWNPAYSDYQAQAGGWETLGLLNSSGRSDQARIDGKTPQPTEVLSELPSVREYLLEESGYEILLARLARVAPGAWMHEHHDDVALGEEKRLRLHIPIETNPEALMTIRTSAGNQSVHLGRGEVWKLNHEQYPHSVSNFGAEARVHLIVDCLVNQVLMAQLEREYLPPEALVEHPTLTPKRKDELVGEAREAFLCARAAGDETAMRQSVELLLSTFHQFNLEGGSSLELVCEMLRCAASEDPFRRYWTERLDELEEHR